MKLSLLRWSAALACMALMAPAAARAEDDLLASIYTDNGFEVRRDERLFTLFAAFNIAGYDRGLRTRELPFPRLVQHPVREKVRQALGSAGEKLRAPVDAFLDKHPQPLEAYVAAALQLGESPAFTPATPLPASLSGLDRMLADFAKAAKSDKVLSSLANPFRAELKRVADAADAPFLALRVAYGLNEETAPMLMLMPNPLDAPDSVLAVKPDEDTHVVVLGVPPPEVKLDLAPALKAYSALLAREQAQAADLKAFEGTVSKLVGLRRLAKGSTAEQVVRASLEAAVAAKLWSKAPDAALAAAVGEGAVLARVFFEAIAPSPPPADEPSPSLAARGLAGFTLERAIVEMDKAGH